jgi:hypothetical protein
MREKGRKYSTMKKISKLIPIPFYLFCLLGIILLVAVTIISSNCGSSNGGSDKSNRNEDVLTLGSYTADPFQFLAVYHDSIKSGSTVEIEFRGSNGYLISVEVSDTSDGVAVVAVPPFMDTNTGFFTSGTVTVAIDEVEGDQPLSINDLLSLDGIGAGQILILILQSTIDEYEDILSNLDTAAEEYSGSLDIESTVSLVNEKIALLNDMIEQIQDTGELELEIDTGTETVTSEHLGTLDRLLTNTIAGISSALNTQSITRRAHEGEAILDWLELSPEEKLERIQEMIDEVGDSIETGVEGQKAYIGGMTAGFSLAGFLVGGPAGAILGAAGGLALGYIGTSLEWGISAAYNDNLDSFFENDRALFDNSEEILARIAKLAAQAGSGLEKIAGKISGTVSNLWTLWDTAEALENLKCATSEEHQQQLPMQFTDEEFCVSFVEPNDVDNDLDGYTENQGDCNDRDLSIYPGATEICDDTVDNDCDGNVDCSDADCSDDPACQSGDGNTLTADVNIPGYYSTTVIFPTVQASFGEHAGEGGGWPVVWGTTGSDWETGTRLSIFIDKNLSGPGTYSISSSTEYFCFSFCTPEITHYDPSGFCWTFEDEVGFVGVSGTITLLTYGISIGDSLKGTFSVNIEGQRRICEKLNGYCDCEIETVSGTISGSFNATLQEHFLTF